MKMASGQGGVGAVTALQSHHEYPGGPHWSPAMSQYQNQHQQQQHHTARSLDRALEDAVCSGILNLSGRKLREYPGMSYDLTDTTQAGGSLCVQGSQGSRNHSGRRGSWTQHVARIVRGFIYIFDLFNFFNEARRSFKGVVRSGPISSPAQPAREESGLCCPCDAAGGGQQVSGPSLLWRRRMNETAGAPRHALCSRASLDLALRFTWMNHLAMQCRKMPPFKNNVADKRCKKSQRPGCIIGLFIYRYSIICQKLYIQY